MLSYFTNLYTTPPAHIPMHFCRSPGLLLCSGSWLVWSRAGVHIPCGISSCPLEMLFLNLQVALSLIENVVWHARPYTFKNIPLPSLYSQIAALVTCVIKGWGGESSSGQARRLFLLMRLKGSADWQAESHLWPKATLRVSQTSWDAHQRVWCGSKADRVQYNTEVLSAVGVGSGSRLICCRKCVFIMSYLRYWCALWLWGACGSSGKSTQRSCCSIIYQGCCLLADYLTYEKNTCWQSFWHLNDFTL